MDGSSIVMAVGGLKTVMDIAGGMLSLKTTSEVQTAVMQLNGAVISTQSSAIAAQQDQILLTNQVEALKAEIKALKEWDVNVADYELADAGNSNWAYRLKNSEMDQWLCPTCFHNRKKSYMNRETISIGRVPVLYCHECKNEIIMSGARHESHKRR